MGETSPVTSNRRPTDPTLLLVERDIGALWQSENLKANRFSVVNMDLVIGDIGLEHTTSKQYFTAAATEIQSGEWVETWGFDFSCSHTHIYPDNRGKSRRFGHAATTIVALELAARALKPKYDVYEKLRIMPATYYVDGFDIDAFKAVKAQDQEFEAKCLEAIEQQYGNNVIYQHCLGMTVTKYVAEKMKDFLDANYGSLGAGPVRCVGDPDKKSATLGRKNRVSDLKVPRTLSEVPPLAG